MTAPPIMRPTSAKLIKYAICIPLVISHQAKDRETRPLNHALSKRQGPARTTDHLGTGIGTPRRALPILETLDFQGLCSGVSLTPQGHIHNAMRDAGLVAQRATRHGAF